MGDSRRSRQPSAITLAELDPGAHALVEDLGGLDAAWREHLQAYGLVPGREVHLVQRSPVTVVEVEHTHLAFEIRLARGIQVEPIAWPRPISESILRRALRRVRTRPP